MNIEQSYVSISSFFDSWSRFIEIPPRIMEAQDSKLKDKKGFINEKIRFENTMLILKHLDFEMKSAVQIDSLFFEFIPK
jgi:hypothetical protein